MTPLEINIATTTKAAQAIEKKLCEVKDIPAKKIISLCKQMNEFIAATNILYQIKAAQSEPELIVKPIMQPI